MIKNDWTLSLPSSSPDLWNIFQIWCQLFVLYLLSWLGEDFSFPWLWLSFQSIYETAVPKWTRSFIWRKQMYKLYFISIAPPPLTVWCPFYRRRDNSQPLLLEILPLENETRLDVSGRNQNTLESDPLSREKVWIWNQWTWGQIFCSDKCFHWKGRSVCSSG